MAKKKLIMGLALIDLAAFLVTVQFFLTRPFIYTYNNVVEKYLNGRTDWDRAWMVLFVSVLISTAIVILFGKDEPKSPKRDAA